MHPGTASANRPPGKYFRPGSNVLREGFRPEATLTEKLRQERQNSYAAAQSSTVPGYRSCVRPRLRLPRRLRLPLPLPPRVAPGFWTCQIDCWIVPGTRNGFERLRNRSSAPVRSSTTTSWPISSSDRVSATRPTLARSPVTALNTPVDRFSRCSRNSAASIAAATDSRMFARSMVKTFTNA